MSASGKKDADTGGWITLAGTALSGLGATLNGMSSLYGATVGHWPTAGVAEDLEPSYSMSGSMASGAVSLIGGWMAASKLGALGTGLSATTVGLGAGCAYASIGFLYFLYSVVKLGAVWPPRHAPVEGSSEAKLYPSPEWLSARVLNWGVIGRVGVGKSTLINSLRGLHPRDANAAPVGIGHTTRRPKAYNFVGDVATLTRNMARLWDLPGAGTKDWPVASYMRDAGLRHFDGVIFVTSDAFSEIEASIMVQLQEFKVPYYLVRNKVDQDVANNAEDNNSSLEASLAEIRHELFERGCDPARTFLISAKHPKCVDFEFGLLLRTMANDVMSQRGELPEFVDENTPPPPQLKDATAFAAAVLPVLPPLPTASADPRVRSDILKMEMKLNSMSADGSGHSTWRLRRMKSIPRAVDGSVSTSEMPPPTKLSSA